MPSGRPELFFGGEEYPMFLQKTVNNRALVPVENLMKPGDYAILARREKTGPDGDRREESAGERGDPYPEQSEALDRNAPLFMQRKEIESVRRQALLQRRPGFELPQGNRHRGTIPPPVRNPAAGFVVLTGYENKRFHVYDGNTAVIDHGQRLTSISMHLKSIDVNPGDRLAKGEIIGTGGSTGISTAPTFTGGTCLYGTSVDPELFGRKEY